MKGKFLKKGISAVMTLALTLGCTSAFAMVDAPAEDNASIIKLDDFEGGSTKPVKALGKGNEIIELGDGNKVIELAAKRGDYKSITLQPNESVARDSVIGFRAMAAQTNESWHMFLRRNATTQEYSDYLDAIGIEFKDDGGIYVIDEGARWGANVHFTRKIADYLKDKWYDIDIFVENANSPDFDTNVYYYINGEKKAVISLKKFATQKNGKGLYFDGTGSLTTLFGGACTGSDSNTGHLYLDDFKISYTDTTEKYYAYGNTDKAGTDGTVNVEFSETPLATEESAKLYSPSGNEITLSGQTVSGRFANYSFDKSSLSEVGEYTLVLPQTKSVTGKKLANNVVVFDKEGAAENGIKSIRLINNTDEFTLYNRDIPANVNKITLSYGAALTSIENAKITLKNKSGDKTISTNAKLSEDKKKIEVKFTQALPSDTYVLSVKYIDGVGDLQREFEVNDDREIVFDKFSVEKNANGKYYADLSVTNYSPSDKSFTLIICEYSNEAIPKMLGIEQLPVEVKSGQNVLVNDSNLKLESKSESESANSKVKAFIWNNVSDKSDGNTILKDSVEYQIK